MTRCKFRCLEITTRFVAADADGVVTTQPTVRLVPVMTRPTGAFEVPPENRRFWDATPSGEITLIISNPDAAATFEVGRDYYVDFIPAG